MDYKLTVDTGAITVPVYDKDNEELGNFKFNPNDLDIVRRYEDVAKEFDSIEIKEDTGVEDVLKISDLVKDQVDYLLGYKVSDTLFGKCNPLTLTGNGDFYIENVLSGIAGLIEETSGKRLAKKQARIKRATAKYHK